MSCSKCSVCNCCYFSFDRGRRHIIIFVTCLKCIDLFTLNLKSMVELRSIVVSCVWLGLKSVDILLGFFPSALLYVIYLFDVPSIRRWNYHWRLSVHKWTSATLNMPSVYTIWSPRKLGILKQVTFLIKCVPLGVWENPNENLTMRSRHMRLSRIWKIQRFLHTEDYLHHCVMSNRFLWFFVDGLMYFSPSVGPSQHYFLLI